MPNNKQRSPTQRHTFLFSAAKVKRDVDADEVGVLRDEDVSGVHSARTAQLRGDGRKVDVRAETARTHERCAAVMGRDR